MTSLSLIPPTAECSTRIATSSVDSLSRADDRLEGALHVGFDDDRQFLATPEAISENICSRVPRPPAAARRVAPPALPEIGNLAGPALVL